jgi:hypothetical protein
MRVDGGAPFQVLAAQKPSESSALLVPFWATNLTQALDFARPPFKV